MAPDAQPQTDQEQEELAPAGASSRRSLLPPLWQRLQQQVYQSDVLQLPHSGVHVSLADLIRDNEEYMAKHGPSEDLASDVFSSYPEDAPPVAGWIGTPDPRKFAPGTTRLSPAEVEEEMQKGNIVALNDWQAALEELEPWETAVLQKALMADLAKNRIQFDIPGDGKHPGGKVSLWDLYHYVRHNPELKALALGQRGVALSSQGNGAAGPEVAPLEMQPFKGVGTDPYCMQLPPTAAQQIGFVRIGEGRLWRRRPTAWLRGLDGQPDFDLAVYVHEESTERELGPSYAGEDPAQLLGSAAYWREVLAKGPALGMTFTLAAAREVPLQHAAECLSHHLLRRMEQQGSWSPSMPLPASVSTLASCLDPGPLLQQTRLLSPQGHAVREGSRLMITCMPDGDTLALQAMTGDRLEEREYYSLGWVNGARSLAGALQSLFLGGGPDHLQEAPLDEDVLFTAPSAILAAANGYRAGAVADNPDISIDGRELPPVTLQPGVKAAFRMPATRPGGRGGPPTPMLLEDVRDTVMDTELHRVFMAAALAADHASSSLPDDADVDHRLSVRREAAIQTLEAGLQSLGLDGEVVRPALQSWATPERRHVVMERMAGSS